MINKLILFGFLLTSAYAESGATITGTVKDPQGRAVPGAALTLVSRTGSTGSATTSDASGVYRFRGLPEGKYLIRVEASGFAPYLAEDIPLAGGAAENRDVVLQLAGIREQVVVTASSTPQAPDEVSKAVSVIDQSDAEVRDNLSIADVVDLTPSVRVQQLGGPGAFTTIQIRGMRDEISEHPMQVLIRCDKPEYLASRLFHEQQVVEVRIHADRAGLLVRTRSADAFYKLLNHIALNGVQIESVSPADDDAQSVYEYLIGTEESTK